MNSAWTKQNLTIYKKSKSGDLADKSRPELKSNTLLEGAARGVDKARVTRRDIYNCLYYAIPHKHSAMCT